MKILLFILFLFALKLASAQKTELPQNQYRELESKARLKINSNIDSSMFYANKIEQSQNSLHQAFSAGLKSYLYQLEGDTKRSDELYKRAFVLLEKSKQSKEKLRVHSVILNFGGLTKWKRKLLSEAVMCFEEGKKISAKISDQIQLIKFSNNISKLNIEAGNFKSAIVASKYSDRISTKIRASYSDEEFQNAKSNIYFNLGYSYEHYGIPKHDDASIDSAISYYDKAIYFSDEFAFTKISSQINMANLYVYREQWEKAEKLYFHLLKVAQENEFFNKELTITFNLGHYFHKRGKYSEALSFFQSIDSLHFEYGIGDVEYMYSNYYMADIYEMSGDYEKSESYLSLSLKYFDRNQKLHKYEVLEMNFLIGQKDMKIAAEQIHKKNQARRTKFYWMIGVSVCILIILILLLVKNIVDKKKANLKVEELIGKFKLKRQQVDIKAVSNQSVTIDDEKEKHILTELKKLLDKEYFTRSDFSLRTVSKRIKTNTTYLSYVVNKNYGKSFGDLSNELKINYVIDQLINNSTYRKYSTQAIAESVGYKSAVSFTKSFKKRTGVTPVQFLNNVNKNMGVV